MTEKDSMISMINQARAEARNDQLKTFLNRHRKTLGTLAVIAVVIGFVVLSFKFYQGFQQGRFSKILHQALILEQLGKRQEAEESLKKIVDSSFAPNGVQSLASFRYAAFLLERRDLAQAAEIYKKVNDCRFCDDYLKDLAGLLLVKTWMINSDESAQKDLAQKIEEVEQKGEVLKYYITEQRALLEMQRDNLEASYKAFSSIANATNVAPDLKERANDGMQMLVSKGYVIVSEIEKNDEVKPTLETDLQG